MKKIVAVLKKILLRAIFFYFLICVFCMMAMWTSDIGSSNELSSNHPDAWVIVGPEEPDWVKNNPAKNWESDKWEAPDWVKKDK